MTNTELKTMIVDELKANGLEIAEDLAVTVVKTLLGLLPKIAIASENKFDDMLIPILGIVEPIIMKELDKIDGKEG